MWTKIPSTIHSRNLISVCSLRLYSLLKRLELCLSPGFYILQLYEFINLTHIIYFSYNQYLFDLFQSDCEFLTWRKYWIIIRYKRWKFCWWQFSTDIIVKGYQVHNEDDSNRLFWDSRVQNFLIKFGDLKIIWVSSWELYELFFSVIYFNLFWSTFHQNKYSNSHVYSSVESTYWFRVICYYSEPQRKCIWIRWYLRSACIWSFVHT